MTWKCHIAVHLSYSMHLLHIIITVKVLQVQNYCEHASMWKVATSCPCRRCPRSEDDWKWGERLSRRLCLLFLSFFLSFLLFDIIVYILVSIEALSIKWISQYITGKLVHLYISYLPPALCLFSALSAESRDHFGMPRLHKANLLIMIHSSSSYDLAQEGLWQSSYKLDHYYPDQDRLHSETTITLPCQS